MDSKRYLEGFISHKQEVIEEYTKLGGWLKLTYGELLYRAASQYSENTAVVDDRNRLAYKEFKGKVDRFAIALIELGLKAHDRIVLQLPNCYEFVVAFYAFRKVGVEPVLAVPRLLAPSSHR